MPAKPPAAGGAGKPASKAESTAKPKPCPVCGKPATEASRPFCSERCRDVDLNRWLSGSYAIPGRPSDEDDGE